MLAWCRGVRQTLNLEILLLLFIALDTDFLRSVMLFAVEAWALL
jgi:hypothetical protein